MSKSSKQNPLDFEKSLAQLTKLVEKMESGKLALEESLQIFEEGVALIRLCQESLTVAEQRVQILNSAQQLEPYQHESEN